MFRHWQARGCFDRIFTESVAALHAAHLLDTQVIHGDGTTTAAKKGGDSLGFNGHKKIKGDKVVAFCDRHCNVIAPFVAASGNRNESPLLGEALPRVMAIARTAGFSLRGSTVSLDGVYDCRANRKPLFDPALFEERFRPIERVFAWEDKFRCLLRRFERISELHYAFKCLAYTMITLRHFCRR
jgi:hypothetical protein